MMINFSQKLEQWCYVAHVHDSLNFDIDLQFNINNKLLMATNYSFKKVENNILLPLIIHSRTYRCRLKGIRLKNKRPFASENKNFNNQRILSNIDVSNLINYQDGWVLLNTHYIDKYNRILVTIYILDKETGIKEDLSKYLIKKYPQVYQNYY